MKFFSLSPIHQAFRGFEPFSMILYHYVDVDCLLVSADQKEWWNLNRRKRPLVLWDLQKKYGVHEQSDQSLKRCISRVIREKQTILHNFEGIQDFTVPILRQGKIEGFLVSGTFAPQALTYGQVKIIWKKIKGAEDVPSLIEFQEFTRVLLETPVLEEPVFSAYRQALELTAMLLTGEGKPEETGRRLRKLLTQVIARCLPHSYFANWALDRPTHENTPLWDKEVQTWPLLREEIGLTRLPTTALIVLPQRTFKTTPNMVEEMVRMNHFQRECFRFSRILGETYSGKLDDYGVVFLTSSDPQGKSLANRRKMEVLVECIHQFAVKQWEGPVVIGVGQAVLPGKKLSASYQQAISALHEARKSGSQIVFYTKGPVVLPSAWGDLKSVLFEMAQRFASASFSDLDLLRDEFLKKASALSQQRPEEARWHFQYALMELSRALEKRLDLKASDRDNFFQRFALELERAGTLQDMVLFFSEALRRLADYVLSPGSSRRTLALEEMTELIGRRFGERLKLPELARTAGMSATALSVKFKAFTGHNFETYLQHRRLEEAEKMLRTGVLPIAQIGRSCGFTSASYFTRVFRVKRGVSPQKYRQKFQKP